VYFDNFKLGPNDEIPAIENRYTQH